MPAGSPCAQCASLTSYLKRCHPSGQRRLVTKQSSAIINLFDLDQVQNAGRRLPAPYYARLKLPVLKECAVYWVGAFATAERRQLPMTFERTDVACAVAVRADSARSNVRHLRRLARFARESRLYRPRTFRGAWTPIFAMLQGRRPLFCRQGVPLRRI